MSKKKQYFSILDWMISVIINFKYKFRQVIQTMKQLVFPPTSINANCKIEGVFGLPEEWKTLDDANPGTFTYNIKFFKYQFQKGKIYPRELTGKEQRELQDKSKKGGKKQSKKQQGNAQEERLKKIQEQQTAKRQSYWTGLPQQDRTYRKYQDSFMATRLRFQAGQKEYKVAGKEYAIFGERIQKDKGEWIYFYKYPAVSEDELAKMRKTKPKTLPNINDLNPIVMRAWVDLSELNSNSKKTTTKRCKIVQVDQTPETPTPNLQNAYIKVNLALGNPFVTNGDGVLGQNLIPNPVAEELLSDKIKVVNELRDELKLGVESLAMEYSSMFWKDLNLYEDLKNMNFFTNKKNDIIKRKEHFLYDFNVSGKYKILKDRLKKTIVHLCEKYFIEQMAGNKSFTGISCTIKDQFYSEIYNFLISKYKQTLQEIIFEKKQNLKEVQVLSNEAQKRNVQNLLNGYSKQTRIERIRRIIQEYEVLGNFNYIESLFKKYYEAEPDNVSLKYQSSIFCIKNQLKKPEEVLGFIEEYLSFNKDDQKVRLQYLLLLIASENEENYKKAWVLLRQIIKINPSDSKNLCLASFLFSQCLNKPQEGIYYGSLVERVELRQSKKIPQLGKHKETPIVSELPTLKVLSSYNLSISQAQKDQIYIQILKIFLKLSLSNVVQKIITKISQTNNPIFNILKLKKLLSQNKKEEFQSLAKESYQSTKSYDILQLLANYYVSIESQLAQKYLRTLLMKSKAQDRNAIMLKMANYYLSIKSFGNSKACILKYIQNKPKNSGVSWRILGICELNIGDVDIGLQCLRKSNLSDIDCSQNWLWLAKIYIRKQNFTMCNQCLNQYEIMNTKEPSASESYKEIKELIQKRKCNNVCEQKLRVQILGRLSA